MVGSEGITMERLTGLYAAPFTAFSPSGEINLEAIELQLQALKANGIRGAIVCGTTGESCSMTTPERMRVLEEWCRAVRGGEGFSIIAHVGHTSINDCIDLTNHAVETGANVIAALPPYYFKPAKVADLIDFFAPIAAAAGSLPFYYYHMPSFTGVDFPVMQILESLGGRIPNFAGVKYTHENLNDMARCIDYDGKRYDILCGRDEILLPALSLGISGAVGSTYNYIAPVYTSLIEAFDRADLETARRLQGVSREVIAVMVKFGGIAAAKRIMSLIGVDCGHVRAPLATLSDERLAEMEKELRAVGFYQHASILPSVTAAVHISEA